MATRLLLQRRAVAPLAASLLAGGVALYPRIAHAEAPVDHHNKKPIYDDYEVPPPPSSSELVKAVVASTAPSTPAATTVSEATTTSSTALTAPEQPAERRTHGPTPTDRLAAQIRRGRLFLYRQACAAEDSVNRAMDRAFNLEKSFTDTIASLAPPRESGERLMPGFVYVLVAAMAGSIVTRRSNVLLRATVPVAFGVGAGWAVMPITMRNCADLAWRYEQRFPAVADAHLRTREAVEKSISFARVHTEVGKRYAEEKVHSVRETVEDWVKKGK